MASPLSASSSPSPLAMLAALNNQNKAFIGVEEKNDMQRKAKDEARGQHKGEAAVVRERAPSTLENLVAVNEQKLEQASLASDALDAENGPEFCAFKSIAGLMHPKC